MKKLIAAAIALSMIGTSAMAAPYQGNANGNRGHVEQSYKQHSAKPGSYKQNSYKGNGYKQSEYRQNNGKYQSRNHYNQWKKGDRFDRNRATNYRVINSPRDYRLYNAPRGYQWVRSGNDAVLIGITSGIVSAIMSNVIR